EETRAEEELRALLEEMETLALRLGAIRVVGGLAADPVLHGELRMRGARRRQRGGRPQRLPDPAQFVELLAQVRRRGAVVKPGEPPIELHPQTLGERAVIEVAPLYVALALPEQDYGQRREGCQISDRQRPPWQHLGVELEDECQQCRKEQGEPQDQSCQPLVVTRIQVCRGESGAESPLARGRGGDLGQQGAGRMRQAVEIRAAQGLTVESLDAAAERMKERLVLFLRQQPLGFLRRG